MSNTNDKAMREALELAKPYVFKASVRHYDGTGGAAIRAEATRRLKLIDAALASSAAAPDQFDDAPDGYVPAQAMWAILNACGVDTGTRRLVRAGIDRYFERKAQPAPAAEAEPVGINGLTDAETDASASVSGLIAAPAADAWGLARFDAWWGGDGRGLHGCEMNRETAVRVWLTALETRPSAPLSEGSHRIDGLGRMTDDDDGFVTLQFVSEAAAEAFMARYEPTVDVDAMPSPSPQPTGETTAEPLSEPTAEGVTTPEYLRTRQEDDVEGTGLTREEFDRYVQQRRDFEKSPAALAALSSPASSAGMDAQPMQPVALDEHGVLRFKRNGLVNALYEHGLRTGMGLNELHTMDFTDADRRQFAQLIGYSVSGYGTLSYVDDDAYERAAMAATPPTDAREGV